MLVTSKNFINSYNLPPLSARQPIQTKKAELKKAKSTVKHPELDAAIVTFKLRKLIKNEILFHDTEALCNYLDLPQSFFKDQTNLSNKQIAFVRHQFRDQKLLANRFGFSFYSRVAIKILNLPTKLDKIFEFHAVLTNFQKQLEKTNNSVMTLQAVGRWLDVTSISELQSINSTFVAEKLTSLHLTIREVQIANGKFPEGIRDDKSKQDTSIESKYRGDSKRTLPPLKGIVRYKEDFNKEDLKTAKPLVNVSQEKVSKLLKHIQKLMPKHRLNFRLEKEIGNFLFTNGLQQSQWQRLKTLKDIRSLIKIDKQHYNTLANWINSGVPIVQLPLTTKEIQKIRDKITFLDLNNDVLHFTIDEMKIFFKSFPNVETCFTISRELPTLPSKLKALHCPNLDFLPENWENLETLNPHFSLLRRKNFLPQLTAKVKSLAFSLDELPTHTISLLNEVTSISLTLPREYSIDTIKKIGHKVRTLIYTIYNDTTIEQVIYELTHFPKLQSLVLRDRTPQGNFYTNFLHLFSNIPRIKLDDCGSQQGEEVHFPKSIRHLELIGSRLVGKITGLEQLETLKIVESNFKFPELPKLEELHITNGEYFKVNAVPDNFKNLQIRSIKNFSRTREKNSQHLEVKTECKLDDQSEAKFNIIPPVIDFLNNLIKASHNVT